MNLFLRIICGCMLASFMLPQPTMAQSREVVCGNTTYARVGIRNFYANICGNASHPTQYVGTSKGGQAIVLPLSSYSDGGYVAVNGNVRYVLTNSYLTVAQNGRTIVREKITSWGD
jgi:hypothetical protein